MKLYVVFDDCPLEHGDQSIIGIYLSKDKAWKRIKREKKQHPYEAQYYMLQILTTVDRGK